MNTYDEFTVITFPDKETGDIVCCFCNCSKCQYLEKCDHADPDHY